MASMKQLGSSKVTGKSQITVPKLVREMLKLGNGDLVVFLRANEEVVVKRGKVEIED
jgi:AbrB family looped-hinge helix DNA binding protein